MHGNPLGFSADNGIDDWLNIVLTQTGGFTGLAKRVLIHRTDLTPQMLETVNTALSHLWHLGPAAIDNPHPYINADHYPDAEHFTVHVQCKNTQWQLTLDSSALPAPATALAAAFPLKPSSLPAP